MRSRSILASFNYAIDGVVYALRTQRNMRIHEDVLRYLTVRVDEHKELGARLPLAYRPDDDPVLGRALGWVSITCQESQRRALPPPKHPGELKENSPPTPIHPRSHATCGRSSG